LNRELHELARLAFRDLDDVPMAGSVEHRIAVAQRFNRLRATGRVNQRASDETPCGLIDDRGMDVLAVQAVWIVGTFKAQHCAIGERDAALRLIGDERVARQST
jgi:hypothetical protein